MVNADFLGGGINLWTKQRWVPFSYKKRNDIKLDVIKCKIMPKMSESRNRRLCLFKDGD